MEAVKSGDLVTLFIDGRGYLGMSQIDSHHLQTMQFYTVLVPKPSKESFPKDFAQRCVFIIDQQSGYGDQGKSLFYGELVRLKHYSSGRYLTISKTTSSQASDKFICQLWDRNSRHSQFMLLPRYKMRTEGEHVYFNDKIKICDKTGEGSYIGYAGKENLVVGQNSVQDGWKIEKFCEFVSKKKQFVFGGDIIRLFHKEIEGYLITRFNDINIRKSREPLSQIIQHNIEKGSKLIGIRQSLTHSDRKESNSILSLWEIENEQVNDGTAIEWDDCFRLKHVVFGEYLEVRYSHKFLQKNNLIYLENGDLVSSQGKEVEAEEIKRNMQRENPESLADVCKFQTVISNADETNFEFFLSKTPNQNTLFMAVQVTAMIDVDYISYNSLVRIIHRQTQAFLKSEEPQKINRLKSAAKVGPSMEFWLNNGSMAGESFDQIQEVNDNQEDKVLSVESDSNSGSIASGATSGTYGTVDSFKSAFITTEQEINKIKKLLVSTENTDPHVFVIVNANALGFDYIHVAQQLVDELYQNFVYLKSIKDEGIQLFQTSKDMKNKLRDIVQIIRLIDTFLKGGIVIKQNDLEYSNQLGVWKNTAIPEDNKKSKGVVYKRPIKRRQRTFNELQCIEILLSYIDYFWSNNVIPHNVTEETVSNKFLQPYLLCKECHELIRNIAFKNINSISILIELGALDQMLQQISTGWNPCISDIFLGASGGVAENHKLTKQEIRIIIDQIQVGLERGEYPHKILDFLSSISAPGGVGDYVVQKWVTDLIIGLNISQKSTPSSLIFHTRLMQDESTDRMAVFITTDNIGFLRPRYIPSKREKGGTIIDYDELLINERQRERQWYLLEHFLPNTNGEYTDLQSFSNVFTPRQILEEYQEQADYKVDVRDKQVLYWRSLLRLFTALSCSQNGKCQKMITGLISIDHIMHALNCDGISEHDKMLYIQLLNTLYIQAASLGPNPKTVLPAILVWKGEHKVLKDEQNESLQPIKLFHLKTQPLREQIISDWVTDWSNFDPDFDPTADHSVLNLVQQKLGSSNYSRQSGSVRDENEITEYDLILKQRLMLYNYLIDTIVDILYEVYTKSPQLAKQVIQPSSQDEEDFTWRYKMEYWIAYFDLLKNVMMRDFFDKDYCQDIQAISDFEDQKANLYMHEKYEELMHDIEFYKKPTHTVEEFQLIPISQYSKGDDMMMIYNLIINILSQTSPQKHYKTMQNRQIDFYNKIFLAQDDNNVASLTCKFKRNMLRVLRVIYDFKTSNRVINLWDYSFKRLYNLHFEGIQYQAVQIKSNNTDMYTFNSKQNEFLSVGFRFYTERIQNRKQSPARFKSQLGNQRRLISDVSKKFKHLCLEDKPLESEVQKLFYASTEEYHTLGNLLIDMVLYQDHQLVTEATNLIHRHFGQRNEVGRIFKEATLLLDEDYYKIYQLMLAHKGRLQQITQNFTKIPSQHDHMIQFYEIFKAGNPLIEKDIRNRPGLIDLCYSGVDLNEYEYSVFRRSKILYSDYFIKRSDKKKNRKQKRLNLNYQQNKSKQQRLQKEMLVKYKLMDLKRKKKENQLQNTVQTIKKLSVIPQVGKQDLWSRNQELMQTVGIYKYILKLLGRLFSTRSKNRPAETSEERYCQYEMIKACYQYLFYFIWENDENTQCLANKHCISQLISQMDFDRIVPRLLSEIFVDNDDANELVSDDDIIRIAQRLDPNTWDTSRIMQQQIQSQAQKTEAQGFMHFLNRKLEGYIKEQKSSLTPPYPVRYIELLKTLVESDFGPKPSRQKLVIEVIIQIQKSNQQQFDSFLLKDSNDNYDYQRVLNLYNDYKIQVEHDHFDIAKVLDPRENEDEFNFHLEFVDLLGMCAKGSNMATTNFCRSLYDEIESIMAPIAELGGPLCIRLVFTRFLHGVYFSDPKHKFYDDDRSGQIWAVFRYRDFVNIFVNMIYDAQKLYELFLRQAQIERHWQELEELEQKEFDHHIEERRKNIQSKMQVKRSHSLNLNRNKFEEEKQTSDPVEGRALQQYYSSDNSDDVEVLRVFAELEQYQDYVFDIMLPFLTDLLKHDFEMYSKDSDNYSYYEPLNWIAYEKADVPGVGVKQSMAFLFRVIIFISVKFSTIQSVRNKETWREAVIDFLQESLKYLNLHYEDDNSIKEQNWNSSIDMQVTIIKVINLLQNVELKNSEENTENDLDQEILDERKKQTLIQDFALKPFLTAVYKFSNSTTQQIAYLTKSLRQEMTIDVQPEFAEYVMLLENHLDNFIGWTDGNWDIQRKRKTYIKKKLNSTFTKDKSLGEIANDLRRAQTFVQLQEQDENFNKNDVRQIEDNNENQLDQDEEEMDSQPGLMSVLPKFKSMMTPNRPITRFSTVGPEKVPMTYGQGFGIDQNQSNDLDDSQPSARQISEGRLSSIGWLNSEQKVDMEEIRSYKIDKKDFVKWTGYGGRYINRLLETLNDIEVTGEAEADEFHLKALQAIMVNHFAGFISVNSLQRKQRAMEELGCIHLVMSLISRAKHPKQISSYLRRILPEVVVLGSNLLALGTQEIQDRFISIYNEGVRKLQPTQYFLHAIKAMIREARVSIKYLCTAKGDPFLKRIVPGLLSFIKNLCEGHHRETQEFLNIQDNSQLNIDLTSELGNFLVAVCEKIQETFYYEESQHFMEKITPNLVTDSSRKRRFISWHHQQSRVPNVNEARLCSAILRTLSEAVQGPCVKNQIALIWCRACRGLQDILDYIGAFFYRKTDKKNTLRWSGHGIQMYDSYLRSNPPSDELDTIHIRQFLHYMKASEIDSEYDMTGKSILIYHDGQMYLNIVESLDTLEQNILVFLNSLLEGSQTEQTVHTTGEKIKREQIREISAYVMESLDIDVLIHNLHNYWKTQQLQKKFSKLAELKDDNLGKWITRQHRRVFLYYSFLTLLIDKSDTGNIMIKNKLAFWERTYDTNMSKIVGKIEIQNANSELEVVYFPLPAVVKIFWGAKQVTDYRNETIYEVNRDNPEEKVLDFQDRSVDIIKLMQLLAQIALLPSKLPIIGAFYKFLAQNERTMNLLFILITLAINILLVMYFEVQGNDVEITSDFGLTLITILGFVHLALATLKLINYILTWGVLYVRRFIRKKSSLSISISSSFIKILRAIIYVVTCDRCCRKRRRVEFDNNVKKSKKIAIPKWIWSIYFFFTIQDTIYYLLILSISIVGAFHNPAYFAFHLIELVRGVRLIKYVLSSVTGNIGQVIATLVLAFIIIFWFTMATFNVDDYRGQYSFEDKMVCDTLLDCLRTHVDYGLTVNPIWNDPNVPEEAIIYNLGYFIIVNLIMTAIISGIIIDTFSEMRSRSQFIQEDTVDRCFICNIDRDDFEKLGLDFSKHIQKDHNMWNYLFIRVYLESLDPTEMTGQETFIHQELLKNTIRFYPIKKSLVIEGRNKEKKDLPSLFMKLDKLDKKVDETLEQIQEEKWQMVEENKKNHKLLEKMLQRLEALHGDYDARH